LERRSLTIENVSPHRKFSAPSKSQVQSAASSRGGSRGPAELQGRDLPCFGMFSAIKGGREDAARQQVCIKTQRFRIMT
jgi:hypothetical protein